MLLSIYIPTYERPNELDRLLTQIVDQVSESRIAGCIEVVVSDNANSTACRLVVEKASIRAHQGSVLYSANLSNLGLDRNFLQCYAKTRGKYVWLLGDDDLLHDKAIEKVVNLLLSSSPGLVRLGYTVESQGGRLIRDLEEGNKVPSITTISPNMILSSFGTSLLRASTLVLKRPSLQVTGSLSASMGVGRYIAPLVMALDAFIEYQSGINYSDRIVRYVEGDKSSWVHLWPWIYSVSSPLAIKRCCSYFQVERKRKRKIVAALAAEREREVVEMILNYRVIPFAFEDFSFLLAYYLVRPSVLRLLMIAIIMRFKAKLLPR
jgi:glycosyltransferase involved in cell wall biosynthesis